MNALATMPENFEEILKLLSAYMCDSSVSHENRRLVIRDRIGIVKTIISKKDDLSNEMYDSIMNRFHLASATAVLTSYEFEEFERLVNECLSYYDEVDIYRDFQKKQIEIFTQYIDRRKVELEKLKKLL
jgi:hypothetical protein